MLLNKFNPKISTKILLPFRSFSEKNDLDSNVVHGKTLADKLCKKLAHYLEQNRQSYLPGLAAIAIGDKRFYEHYARSLRKLSEQLNINFFLDTFSENGPIEAIQEKIGYLNKKHDVNGIVVFQPILKLEPSKIIDVMDPSKDVDGLTKENLNRLILNTGPHHIASTPSACLHILREKNIDVAGKKCVIVNRRSRSVGIPLGLSLLNRDAFVNICHPKANDLSDCVRQCDILFTAIGDYNFVKAEWIQLGTVVIDIGMNRIINEQGKTQWVGDLNFKEAKRRASLITPVPEGVGPLTGVMLMKGVVSSWAKSYSLKFNYDEF